MGLLSRKTILFIESTTYFKRDRGSTSSTNNVSSSLFLLGLVGSFESTDPPLFLRCPEGRRCSLRGGCLFRRIPFNFTSDSYDVSVSSIAVESTTSSVVELMFMQVTVVELLLWLTSFLREARNSDILNLSTAASVFVDEINRAWRDPLLLEILALKSGDVSVTLFSFNFVEDLNN